MIFGQEEREKSSLQGKQVAGETGVPLKRYPFQKIIGSRNRAHDKFAELAGESLEEMPRNSQFHNSCQSSHL